MQKFSVAATGGTFDIVHIGHVELLSKAFSVSEKVIIGLTSDALALKKGKSLVNKYEQRLAKLKEIISAHFPEADYQISSLDDDFGPAVLQGDVQALVVSGETQYQGDVLNKLRSDKNLLPVKIVLVPMLLAKDGMRISTTRIKNSEIDKDGNLLSVDP